jgi:hypothetical protein
MAKYDCPAHTERAESWAENRYCEAAQEVNADSDTEEVRLVAE